MTLRHLAVPLVVLGAVVGSACGSSPPATPAPPCTTNSAIVAWDSPTSGGTATVDQSIGGFYIYVGRGPRAYDRRIPIEVTSPVAASYEQRVSGLGLGTYYFTVAAFNGSGESVAGNEVGWSFSACGVASSLSVGSP